MQLELLFENKAQESNSSLEQKVKSTKPDTCSEFSLNPSQKNSNTQSIHSYKLIRTRRRTLSLSVDKRTVVVRAPLRASIIWIEEFIKEKTHWIDKQLQEQQEQLSKMIKIVDGATILVLDKALTLRISSTTTQWSSNRKKIFFRQASENLHLFLSNKSDSHSRKNINTVFFKWVHSVASDYMVATTQKFAEQMSLSEKLGKVTFRRTKTKWGHCTSSGDIQYNPLAVLAPRYVVDYIITHELCHLSHRNHSKLFWKMVEKNCPNWKKPEQWLKKEGYTLAIGEE